MNRLSRYCDGLIEASWLLTIIVVSLYFLPSIERPFGVGKTTAFRVFVFIGGAAWLFKLIENIGVSYRKTSRSFSWGKIKDQPIIFLVGLLAFVYILATILSISPVTSLMGSFARYEGLFTLLSYLTLFALLVSNLRWREQADRLIAVLTVVSFAIDLYAVLQHFGLDPLSWSNSVSSRAISTIGHPIFLASFLGMSLIVMLGRSVTLLTLSKLQANFPGSQKLISVYLFVCVLNLLAIWYAVARGPLIALFFGLMFLGSALLVYWQLRRIFFGFLFASILVLLLVAVLNISNGPLARWRDAAFVGPIGHMFDTESGTTGRSRLLIWDGVLRLVTPHAPIQLFASQTADRWNAIRPLIGYGPETLYLVYENYYVPEQFAMESYTLEVDHAHNEFWDTLAFYGLLGLFVEYGFFLTMIYYGLKWLGWIASIRDNKIYWSLCLLGGVLGAIIAMLTGGMAFIGIGIPFGLLLGPASILALRMFQNDLLDTRPDPWRDPFLIASLALIVFYYVEILFGVPVLTSRIIFWVSCGVMLKVGYGLPSMACTAADAGAIKGTQTAIHTAVVITAILAMIPIFASIDLGKNSIPTNSNLMASSSFILMGLFLVLILFVYLFFELEATLLHGYKFSLPNLICNLGVSVFSFTLGWILYTKQMEPLQQFSGINPAEAAGRYLFFLGIQFGVWFVFAYVWAFLLYKSQSSTQQIGKVQPPMILVFGSIQALMFGFSIFVDLRPLQADGLAKLFNSYIRQGQYVAALDIGEQMPELDPWQDTYLRGLADTARVYGNSLPAPQNVREYAIAEKNYKRAYALNPLYYLNIINLARMNRAQAEVAQDIYVQKRRVAQAEQFYAEALQGKPYRVKLWVEWGEFRAEFGDLPGAQEKASTAFKIDNTYAPAYALSALVNLIEADSETDGAKKAELLTSASKSVTTQIEMLQRRGESPALPLMQLGDIYAQLGRYDDARAAYSQAEKIGLGDWQWLVYRKLAELCGVLKDPASQREYLQKAIAQAPSQEIQTLKTMLNSVAP